MREPRCACFICQRYHASSFPPGPPACTLHATLLSPQKDEDVPGKGVDQVDISLSWTLSSDVSPPVR